MSETKQKIRAEILRTAKKIKPVCFGTTDVENLDGQYKGKCLICGIEDECVGVYLRHIADGEENQ